VSVSVLHVTDAFWPEHGGVERVIAHLAAAQAAAGWHVTVLTKSTDGAGPIGALPGPVRILRYQQAKRPTPWVYFTTWRSSRRWSRIAAQTQPPDLVHAHLTLSAQGPLDFFQNRVPFVATFYGPWHAEFAVEAAALQKQKSPLYRAYLHAQIALQRRLQQRLLNRAHRVAVLSEFSRSWIERLAPHRAPGATLVPGGVDPDRFFPQSPPKALRKKHGLPDNAFVVLTLRRLVERMGIDLLLEATAQASKQHPRLHLLIAGSGPAREKLERQANELGIADRIRFLGYVPDDEVPDLYRLADLFIVPTRAEENFGLIVLEAAACGTPVAATPAGSLPELMRAVDDRYLAADVSAQALTDVLLRAVDEGAKAKKHFTEKVALCVREQFTWQVMADRYRALYGELGVG